MLRLLLFLLLITIPLFSNTPVIMKFSIDGAIGPASSNYVKEVMASAKKQNANIILLELNTPGGLSTSMREIIQEILSSNIPVVTYVYPKGSRAASAGTYILYASHVAAMSPGTNLGAATPVNMMPSSEQADSNASKTSTLEKKAINDSMAYIKSLAQINDRNVSWALEAVKESKSLSAKDALKNNVIDLIAEDTDDLIHKLNGMSVKVSDKNITLKTDNATIITFEADFKTRFLSIVSDPNMAYMFLLIAIYGIFFELMNPGAIVPGVVGAISAVIALYSLNILPFNYAGLLLILLGISFMIAEVLVAGFGVLGIGGVISFAFGSVLLFDAQTLGSSVSIPLVISFTLVSLAFFIFVMKLFIGSRSAKIVSGIEEMIGSMAEVTDVKGDKYYVHCHGETWSAKSQSKLSVGQMVEILNISDLILEVKPIKE